MNPKASLPVVAVILVAVLCLYAQKNPNHARSGNATDRGRYSDQLVEPGKFVFRYDTFGDQEFWGGSLRLHQVLEGFKLGGVGPGVAPATALAVGLKVDQDALPPALLRQMEAGHANLNDPAVTLALLQLNAVVAPVPLPALRTRSDLNRSSISAPIFFYNPEFSLPAWRS